MKQNKKYDIWKNICIVSLPFLMFFIWVVKGWSINYQVHDDRYMMEFLSGKFLGYSDAHLVYIKYPLAILIQGFYKISSGHDWYAATILAIQMTMVFILTWYIVRKQKEWIKKIISIFVFYSIFILCWINEITCFTYTTAAALVGVTILVVYVLGEDRIWDYVILCILSFFAYNLRSDLFFMILPVCGILWIYKMLQKEKVKMQIGLLIAILLLVGGSFFGNYLAYGNANWSDYMAYNKARTQVYDYAYEDIIHYDNYVEMYEELGISREQCKIIESYDLSLYDEVLYDKVEEIAKKYENPRSVSKRLTQTVKVILKDGILESKIMTLVSVFLWLLAFLYTCYTKNKKIAVMEVAFLFVHILLWLYLGYKGRILPRVSHSMLLMQIVTPLISLYYMAMEQEKKEFSITWKRVSIILFGLFVLGMSAYDVRLSKKLIRKNQKEADYGDQYMIEEYCNSHKDNFYFLDVFSVVECKYVFDFHNENTYENFVSLGDWFGNNPLYQAKLEVEGIESVRDAVLYDDSVYVIGIAGRNLEYIADITDEKVEIEPVDYLDGGMDDYVVYRVVSQGR